MTRTPSSTHDLELSHARGEGGCMLCGRRLISVWVNGQRFQECPVHGSRGDRKRSGLEG